MFEKEQKILTDQIEKLLKNEGWIFDAIKWSWIPFSGHWGLSTSFFEIVSITGKPDKGSIAEQANALALRISSQMNLPNAFIKVEAVSGYLNFYFQTSVYAQQVVDHILLLGNDFGKGQNTFQKVMVEFSQPNTHKAFHVGHLRNMVIGDAIARISEFSGNEVIRANYLGDIGLHVITWLWNYLKNHKGEKPPEVGKTRWIGNLYSEAVQGRDSSKENEEEVRSLFKRWDQRDAEIVSLWEQTRAWSLDAFNEIYSILGITFDKLYYESEVEDSGKRLVADLIASGLAKDERPDGAVIIDLDEILGTNEEYRVVVILRSDGTSLYATKDIPLAIKKFREFNLDKSIYVIDVRQSLYMKQIFKILALMGHADLAKRCFHLAYEIVNLPGNVTIASRDGAVVLLEDLINEAEKRALEIVEIKNPELDNNNKQQVAYQVALGSIKYPLLSRDTTKLITFEWESALNVNGQAAPYIQYAAVRANSILRKVQFTLPKPCDPGYTLTRQEIELLELLSRFPREVQRAAKEMKPHFIATYAYEVAKAFSDFYTNCPVLVENSLERNFRLRITAASKITIQNSLNLLGITTPTIM